LSSANVVLDVDVEVADHDVAVVEIVMVVVAIEPEAQKIARFWRQRQRICGGGGLLGQLK
jgi:hypothetical protein